MKHSLSIDVRIAYFLPHFLLPLCHQNFFANRIYILGADVNIIFFPFPNDHLILINIADSHLLNNRPNSFPAVLAACIFSWSSKEIPESQPQVYPTIFLFQEDVLFFFSASFSSFACFLNSAISKRDKIFGTQPHAHFGAWAVGSVAGAFGFITTGGGGGAEPPFVVAHIKLESKLTLALVASFSADENCVFSASISVFTVSLTSMEYFFLSYPSTLHVTIFNIHRRHQNRWVVVYFYWILFRVALLTLLSTKTCQRHVDKLIRMRLYLDLLK